MSEDTKEELLWIIECRDNPAWGAATIVRYAARIEELKAGLDEAIYLLGLDKQPPLIPSEQRIIDARRGGGE